MNKQQQLSRKVHTVSKKEKKMSCTNSKYKDNMVNLNTKIKKMT